MTYLSSSAAVLWKSISLSFICFLFASHQTQTNYLTNPIISWIPSFTVIPPSKGTFLHKRHAIYKISSCKKQHDDDVLFLQFEKDQQASKRVIDSIKIDTVIQHHAHISFINFNCLLDAVCNHCHPKNPQSYNYTTVWVSNFSFYPLYSVINILLFLNTSR